MNDVNVGDIHMFVRHGSHLKDQQSGLLLLHTEICSQVRTGLSPWHHHPLHPLLLPITLHLLSGCFVEHIWEH